MSSDLIHLRLNSEVECIVRLSNISLVQAIGRDSIQVHFGDSGTPLVVDGKQGEILWQRLRRDSESIVVIE